MNKILKRYKLTIVLCIIIFLISGMGVYIKNNQVNKGKLKDTLQEINNMCNSVYGNVDYSEIKYLELFNNEEDPLRKGMYASTLLQVYAIKSDYDKVVKYGELAVENYMKVEGGVYYAISERKYLLWTMFGLGRYSEAFRRAHEVIEMMNLYGDKWFSKNEIDDTESLVYSILLMIYSQFELKENADIYYSKLNDIEMTPELEFARGEKLAYSKMLYAKAFKDYDLMKKYSEECYRISLKNDKLKNVSTAEATLMDVAYANIKLENLQEGLQLLKRAEVAVEGIGSEISIADIYNIYAEYYDKINNFEKASEYYEKSIAIHEKVGNKFRTSIVIKSYIDLLERNNKSNEVNKYYKKLFDIGKSKKEDGELGNLLIEAVEINDKLSNQKLLVINKQKQIVKVTTGVFTILIVALFIIIYKMKKIMIIKNINEKKLEEIINKDYLTGVNTRNYGYRQIEDLIKVNKSFSIGVLDLDNFKSINDTYGHLFGDEALKLVAITINEYISEEDIVIRFGGEEFIVVLLDKTKEEAKYILNNIRLSLNNKTLKNNVKLSFSAGVEEWQGENLDTLIDRADKKLYSAKREGKNKVN